MTAEESDSAVLSIIRKHAELLSILYDLDLMLEQLITPEQRGRSGNITRRQLMGLISSAFEVGFETAKNKQTHHENKTDSTTPTQP